MNEKFNGAECILARILWIRAGRPELLDGVVKMLEEWKAEHGEPTWTKLREQGIG